MGVRAGVVRVPGWGCRHRRNPGVVESRGFRRSELVAGRGFEPLTFGL